MFLWILTVFKIIEIRLSDVSSFFGGDFTEKRRRFRWDEEAKAGGGPCEEGRSIIRNLYSPAVGGWNKSPCASFRQVLVQPVPQAGARHGLSSSVNEGNERARMTSLPNETAVATAIPFEMMEEAATLVSDEEEGGKKYRRVSIGGSARKRSFEREKEEGKNRESANK